MGEVPSVAVVAYVRRSERYGGREGEGEALGGGNIAPVVRVGDTVRRETGPWTPAVHALLISCEEAGVDGTPRVRGIDEHGREILSFLPGEVLAGSDVQWSRDALRDAARLLRRIHDAGAPLTRRSLTWRAPVHRPAEVVCRNDFAPYNLIVRDGRLVGAIDFDFASPGPRIWDVAYLAYRIAPYAEDAERFDPGRHGSPDERVAMLVEAYGGPWSVADIRAAISPRLDELAAWTDEHARATGRDDLRGHAAMYRPDADRLRA